MTPKGNACERSLLGQPGNLGLFLAEKMLFSWENLETHC